MEIFKIAKDKRTNTNVIYAQLEVLEYLNIVGENFDDYEIQRKRETHKIYQRLKKDIIQGTLLPGITLAVKSEFIEEVLNNLSDENKLKTILTGEGVVNILDGLQRTYILKDICSEETTLIENLSNLFVEFWVEPDVKNLIYRLLVLNSGQKQMSSNHQIELLFSLIKNQLCDEIDGLILHREKNETSRRGPKQFQFSKIAMGYQCFLQKNSEIKKDNIIAEKIKEEEILTSTKESLGEGFEKFKKYLTVYTKLDEVIYRKSKENPEAKTENWLNDDSVIQSYFSSISKFISNSGREERTDKALEKLLFDLETQDIEEILGLELFGEIKTGVDSKRKNVGSEIRRIIGNVFTEYFRDEGETLIKNLWSREA